MTLVLEGAIDDVSLEAITDATAGVPLTMAVFTRRASLCARIVMCFSVLSLVIIEEEGKNDQ